MDALCRFMTYNPKWMYLFKRGENARQTSSQVTKDLIITNALIFSCCNVHLLSCSMLKSASNCNSKNSAQPTNMATEDYNTQTFS